MRGYASFGDKTRAIMRKPCWRSSIERYPAAAYRHTKRLLRRFQKAARQEGASSEQQKAGGE